MLSFVNFKQIYQVRLCSLVFLKRPRFYHTIFPCSQTSAMMEFFLVIFFASLTTCSPNIAITPELLESVFGSPDKVGSDPPKISLAQAIPVLPDQSELGINDNDENSNQFVPSIVEYDKFDWTLTKRVASVSQENLLISPLGLKLALAILMEAATGITKTELSSVLGLDRDNNVVRQKFATILDSLHTKSPQYILNLGSRIYVGGHIVPQQRFAAISEQFYKTEIKSLDFSDPISASKCINQWVANSTHGRITNLVIADDVSGVSSLVLNTIFFKGTWRHQFPINETKNDVFYISPILKKDIPFMNVRNKFYYTESARYNAKILRMAYVGNKFAMYIILPNSLTGLSSIFNELSDLRSELNYLQERLVDVTLPKFQFEYTSLLDGVLRELGIRQAFEDTASFPGISRGQYLNARLKISKVLQRSGIEVNELGSVAYSATEFVLENKFGGDVMPSAEIIANKPFLFFIQDDQTKQLLFTGRVSDPSLYDGAFKL